MKKSNKGFSLVELIIVVSIMTILIGVAVPFLMRYLNRTYVSADVQLIDSIQHAIEIAMNDPDVVNSEDLSRQQINNIKSGNVVALDEIGDSIFKDTMNDIIGYDVCSVNLNRAHFRSKQAKSNGVVKVQYYDSSFVIWIDGSDATGRDNVAYSVASAADIHDNEVIYVK